MLDRPSTMLCEIFVWLPIYQRLNSHCELGENQNQNNNIQCPAIRREFETVGPTLLKNPLGVGWGVMPTL